MSEPMITRSITIREVLDEAAGLQLETVTDGDPTLWDQIGMLEVALAALRRDAAEAFNDDPELDDD